MFVSNSEGFCLEAELGEILFKAAMITVDADTCQPNLARVVE